MGKLIYEDLTYQIRGVCMEVYKELGRGFVEYVYQDAMAIEFKLAGIDYEKESQLKIYYKGNELERYYRADFICFGKIIVEVKAAATLQPEHSLRF